MKCSIALTTFNSAKYLEQQLQSIAEQTVAPYQLVVCDDGSTDATLEILNRFKASASFNVEIILNEKNLGYSQNFAKAISNCSGDIIFLADHDDIWVKQKLEAYVTAFQRLPNAAGIFSDSILFRNSIADTKVTLFETNRVTEEERIQFLNGKGLNVLLRRNIVAGHAMAFKADLKNVLLPIPNGQYHDAWIAMICSVFGGLYLIDGAYVYYRQHQSQNIGVVAGSKFNILRARLQRAKNSCELDIQLNRFFGELEGRCASRHIEKSVLQIISEKKNWLDLKIKKRANGFWGKLSLLMNYPNYVRYEQGFSSLFKDLLN